MYNWLSRYAADDVATHPMRHRESRNDPREFGDTGRAAATNTKQH